jgi:hypothetical protein
MRVTAVAAITIAALLPSSVLAQTPAQDAARAGAGVGAAVGGLVGAAIELPAEVLSAVTGAPLPAPVEVREKVVVGQPLPESVVLTPVPSDNNYAHAVVNKQHVIVDRRTRRVVKIVN